MIQSICQQFTYNFGGPDMCSAYPCLPTSGQNPIFFNCDDGPFTDTCASLLTALRSREDSVQQDLLSYPDQTGQNAGSCSGGDAWNPACASVGIDQGTLAEIRSFRVLVYQDKEYEDSIYPPWCTIVPKVAAAVGLALPDLLLAPTGLDALEIAWATVELAVDAYDLSH